MRLAAREMADARHAAREVLWAESSLERVRKCGRVTVSGTGHVAVRFSEGIAGYAGLATCGSVWACPVCSAKILAQRREEVAAAITAAVAAGLHMSLVTLTARHHAGQSLAQVWDAVGSAWSATTSGGRWQLDKERFGVAGWLRTVEVTHGWENGWHPHVHVLVFTEDPLSTDGAVALGLAMHRRWGRALRRKGFDSIAASGGLDAKPVTARGAADTFSKYVTKATYDGAASEMTLGPMTKAGRMGNRVPFGILASLIDNGEARDLEAWREYEEASRGRRAVTWSRGLRDLLRLGDEATDEELAEKELSSALATVLMLPPPSWTWLRNSGNARHLLHLIEDRGVTAALDWLDACGVAWLLPQHLSKP